LCHPVLTLCLALIHDQIDLMKYFAAQLDSVLQ
jgi:hypothetical protein